MKKKIIALIKLEIPAGKANPAPPIGPALGQRGLNIMEFCKQFNERTKDSKPGTPTPVVIEAYADKTFSFITKNPPVSYYVKEFAGISSGSKTPGRAIAGKITVEKISEIAKIKMSEMGVDRIESAMNMIKGTARSMGVEVIGG